MLRDYQQAQIDELLRGWERYRAGCLQLCTGGGKSLEFSAIATHFPNQPILALAHRRELVEQAAEHLHNALNEPVGILEGGQHDLGHRVLVSSVQSFMSLPRPFLPKSAGLVIFDECQHSPSEHWRHTCEDLYPQAKILGCTATPIHESGRPLAEIFDFLVTGPQMKTLMHDGFLSQYGVFSPPASPSLERILKDWKRYGSNQPTIIFAASLQQSLVLADRFNQHNIPTAHLDAHTPHDARAKMLDQLKTGELKIISNYRILGEGVDIPQLDCLIILRRLNLVGWLQACGRILRIYPDKPAARIIDYADNWRQHGFPSDRRVWRLDGHELMEFPHRSNCKHCHRVFKTRLGKCPSCNGGKTHEPNSPRTNSHMAAQIISSSKTSTGISSPQT